MSSAGNDSVNSHHRRMEDRPGPTTRLRSQRTDDGSPVSSGKPKEIASEPGAGIASRPASRMNLKYISLTLLTLQNALLILVMRYTRTRDGEMYFTTTVVILSEVVKLFTCLFVIFWQEGRNLSQCMTYLNRNICQQPYDCLKMSVPAVVYTLQNNLLFVAVSNLEATTYQVTYQLKIMTTAIFSVIMMGKQLSRTQWFSLFLLFVGVSVVQLQMDSGIHSDSDPEVREQNPVLGLVAVIIACFMSAFAGIYFEKTLKGSSVSLWVRNVQLCSIGVVMGFVTMWISDGDEIRDKGFFYGYTWAVLAVVSFQAFGGLMVALVVKYADNILKGFSTSASIVISCIASIYFFNFNLTLQFSIGTMLVILSVYLYSKYTTIERPKVASN